MRSDAPTRVRQVSSGIDALLALAVGVYAGFMRIKVSPERYLFGCCSL